MQKIVFLVLLALSAGVQASYVESCVFNAQLLEDASTRIAERVDGTEESSLDLNVKILSARTNGRADSGCTHFKDQNMQVSLSQNVPLVSYKKGDRIKLRYLYKDNAGMPGFTLYEILK